MNKICIKCKQEKPIEEFWKDIGSIDGKDNVCKKCNNDYQNNWYQLHKRDPKHLKVLKISEHNRKNNLYQNLKNYLNDKKCINCEISNWKIIEFHHRNPKEKEYEISVMMGNLTIWSKILLEIQKCDILCGNCHREKHMVEWNSFKYKWLSKNLKIPIDYSQNYKESKVRVKICNRCKIEKSLEEFGICNSEKDGFNLYCKQCDYEEGRKHYLKIRNNIIKNLDTPLRAWKREEGNIIKKQWYVCEYLNTHPCVDCGDTNILVLEFDHIKDKLIDIGNMIDNPKYSLENLQIEIQKCEVRCRNCHRLKTFDKEKFINYIPR